MCHDGGPTVPSTLGLCNNITVGLCGDTIRSDDFLSILCRFREALSVKNRNFSCPSCRQFTPARCSCNAVSVQTRSSTDADNRHDAFSGQSRSTNIVPFHILGIVSYCAIVTLSFRRALFTIFDFKKSRDLEIGVRGHSMSL